MDAGLHDDVKGLPPELFRHWIHSREEDARGLETYRPEGFEFPPSFGRDGFEMRTDGTFVQDDIGPADGVVQVVGQWRLNREGGVDVSFPGAGREGFSFDVASVDEQALLIRRRQATSTPPYEELPAMEERSLASYHKLPPATSSRLIDFEYARILALRSLPPQFVLRVSGVKPSSNTEVELVPLVFVRQPEYWEIEVVGTMRGVGLPALEPYSVSLPLAGVIGTLGIEVVGASRRQRFDLPTMLEPRGNCDWHAFIDRQPPGPAMLHVQGACEFPTAGFRVELRRHEPQGINPRDLLLDKTVQGPDGPAAEVITSVEARYEEETSAGFDTVTILPGGDVIPVAEVQ